MDSRGDRDAQSKAAAIDSNGKQRTNNHRRRSNNGGSTSPAPSLLSTASSGSPLVRAGSSLSASSATTTASSSSSTSSATTSSASSSSAARHQHHGPFMSNARSQPVPTKIAAAQLQCQQQLGELANNKLAMSGAANLMLKAGKPSFSSSEDKAYRAASKNEAAHKLKQKESQSGSKHSSKSFGYNMAKSLAFRANRFNEFWSANKMRYLNFVCLLMTLVCLLTILFLSGSERTASSANNSNNNDGSGAPASIQLALSSRVPVASSRHNQQHQPARAQQQQQSIGGSAGESIDSSESQPLVRKQQQLLSLGSDETIVDHNGNNNGRDNNNDANDNTNTNSNSNTDDESDDENPFENLFDDKGVIGSKSRRDSMTGGGMMMDDEILGPSKRLSTFLSSSSSSLAQEQTGVETGANDANTIGSGSSSSGSSSGSNGAEQRSPTSKHHPHRGLVPMLIEPMFSQSLDDFGSSLFRQLLSANDSQLGRPIVRRHKNGATIIISSSSLGLNGTTSDDVANGNSTTESKAGSSAGEQQQQLPQLLEKLLPPMLRPLALLSSRAMAGGGGANGHTTKTIQTPFGTATITINSISSPEIFRPMPSMLESRFSPLSTNGHPIFASPSSASPFADSSPLGPMFAPLPLRSTLFPQPQVSRQWPMGPSFLPFMPPPPGLMSLLMRSSPVATATIVAENVDSTNQVPGANNKNKTDAVNNDTAVIDASSSSSSSSSLNNATTTMSNATMATDNMKAAATGGNSVANKNNNNTTDDDVEVFDVARMLQQMISPKQQSAQASPSSPFSNKALALDGGLRMRPMHLPGISSGGPMIIMSGSMAKETPLPFDGPPMFMAQSSSIRPHMILSSSSSSPAESSPLLRAILGNVMSELAEDRRKPAIGFSTSIADHDSDNEDNDWSSGFGEQLIPTMIQSPFSPLRHSLSVQGGLKQTQTGEGPKGSAPSSSSEKVVTSSETVSDFAAETDSITGAGGGNGSSGTAPLISGTIRQTFHGPGVTVERIIELPRNKQQQQQQMVPAGTRSQSLSNRADFSDNGSGDQSSSTSVEYPSPFAVASARSIAHASPLTHPMAFMRHNGGGRMSQSDGSSADSSSLPMPNAGPIGGFIRHLLSDIGSRRGARVSKRLSIEEDGNSSSDEMNVESDESAIPDRSSAIVSFGEPRIRVASARIRIPRPALIAGPEGVFPSPFAAGAGAVAGERESVEPPAMNNHDDSIGSVDERLSHALSLLHNDLAQQTFDRPTSPAAGESPKIPNETNASDQQQPKSRDDVSIGSESVASVLPLAAMNARAQPRESTGASPFTSPSSPFFGFPMSGMNKLQQQGSNKQQMDDRSSDVPDAEDINQQRRRRGRTFTYHSNHEVAGSQQVQKQQQVQHAPVDTKYNDESMARHSSKLPPPAAIVMGRRLDDGPFEDDVSNSGESMLSSDNQNQPVQERRPSDEPHYVEHQKLGNQNHNNNILFRGRAMPPQQIQHDQQQQHHQGFDNYRTIVV